MLPAHYATLFPGRKLCSVSGSGAIAIGPDLGRWMVARDDSGPRIEDCKRDTQAPGDARRPVSATACLRPASGAAHRRGTLVCWDRAEIRMALLRQGLEAQAVLRIGNRAVGRALVAPVFGFGSFRDEEVAFSGAGDTQRGLKRVAAGHLEVAIGL